MGKPKAPKAPDPIATANAQTASNRETAITQFGLNAVNQTDASGNTQTWNQIGTWSDGTPRYETKQTLSAPNQQLLNTGQQTSQNLANLAQEQSGRLSGLLSAPLDWSAQQGYLNDLTDQNLNPQWDRMAEQNSQSLINRGIRQGSTQYTQAMDDFNRSRSSAFNDARLSNYNNALQSQLAIRQAPINEISALAGGGQISGPAFANTGQTGVAGTDVSGIINQGYANQMSQYNAQQKGFGGLFDAGLGLLKMSDRRMKTDIKRIGTADNGLGIYLYRYVTGGPFQIGVMAQEVEEVNPKAVVMGPDNYKRVNYSEAFA